jgi:hypothetical protein
MCLPPELDDPWVEIGYQAAVTVWAIRSVEMEAAGLLPRPIYLERIMKKRCARQKNLAGTQKRLRGQTLIIEDIEFELTGNMDQDS